MKLIPYSSRTESCTRDGDVRLVGGSTEREGHMELCLDNYWGNVCLYIVNLETLFTFADVACNQLGYPTKCESVIHVQMLCSYIYACMKDEEVDDINDKKSSIISGNGWVVLYLNEGDELPSGSKTCF